MQRVESQNHYCFVKPPSFLGSVFPRFNAVQLLLAPALDQNALQDKLVWKQEGILFSAEIRNSSGRFLHWPPLKCRSSRYKSVAFAKSHFSFVSSDHFVLLNTNFQLFFNHLKGQIFNIKRTWNFCRYLFLCVCLYVQAAVQAPL